MPLRVDVAHRVVLWQRNKRRRGLHDENPRAGEGDQKARPQKGGGRARVGDLRAPQMRGVAHGPVVRSHETGLQRKVRRLGLKVALSTKLPRDGWWCWTTRTRTWRRRTKWLDGALDALLGAGALAAGERQHSVLLAEITPDETTPGVGRLAADPRSADWCRRWSRAPSAASGAARARDAPAGLNVYDILRCRSLAITGTRCRGWCGIDAPIKR